MRVSNIVPLACLMYGVLGAGCGGADNATVGEIAGDLDAAPYDATTRDGAHASGGTDAPGEGGLANVGGAGGQGGTDVATDASQNGGGAGDQGGAGNGGGGGDGGLDASIDGASAGGAAGGGAETDAFAGGAGQSSQDPDGGFSDAGPDVRVSCGVFGDTCQHGSDCCSSVCNTNTSTCDSTVTVCANAGTPCSAPTDCCTLRCSGGVCAGTACVSDNQTCAADSECCSGKCENTVCTPLNLACKTAGNGCAADNECCSQLCRNGQCALGASYCIQTGDACVRNEDCCGGLCSLASGRTTGTCAVPEVGASNCQGAVDGTVCNGCGVCCSRLCAPFGPTGVDICQPANGCHITGDLCRRDSDCCGAAGSGLPGDGNVRCEKAVATDPVGVCRNPTGCNPEGDVCHYKEYACSISSARNDCCGAQGNSGVCQLDSLGVPRCYGLGNDCRQSGETCAASMDCCDGMPCIPDQQGQLRCLTQVDGGLACSPFGGGCTVDGDCCPGHYCIRQTGSILGTCGDNPVSHPDAGTLADSGSGSDATTPPPDASRPPADGASDGAVVDSAADSASPHPTCSLYGQVCSATLPCCNTVPCYNGTCRFIPQ